MAVPKMSDSPMVPYRRKNRTSDKLIFISCEGSATEWDYFEKIINAVFVNVKTKVTVVNVLEDALSKRANKRTREENKLVTSSNPKNVLEKMNTYKEQHNEVYDFSVHSDDEFWLILDTDHHTGVECIDEWKSVLLECKTKGYKYAVSNPFFELWLLLHFDIIKDEDYSFAVTDGHPYEPTNHYRERLRELNVPLKKDKHIRKVDYVKYAKENIRNAISRAKDLDSIPKCDYPTDLGTTVYRLLESIAEIDSQYGNN